MPNIKIVTINIRGLEPSLSSLATIIHNQHIHIAFIQETYLIKLQSLTQFEQKHNFHLITNMHDEDKHNTQQHRQGTAIVINKTLLSHIPSISYFTNIIIPKRIQSLTLQIETTQYCFINLYLSSGDKQTRTRKQEIRKLEDHISKIQLNKSKLYILGDFNFVLYKKDRTGIHHPLSMDKTYFRNLASQFKLIDIFRHLHPHTTQYTLIYPNYASRIDRIYTTNTETQNITNFTHLPIIFSDHKQAPCITIKTTNHNKHKSTYWKLNTSILTPDSNKKCINAHIKHKQHSPKPISDPLSWWEKSKSIYKKYLIFLSRRHTHNQNILKKNTETQIQMASKNNDFPRILNLNQKLDKIISYKKKGALIRSRELPLHPLDPPPPNSFAREQSNQRKQQIPPTMCATQDTQTQNTTSHITLFQFFSQIWNPVYTPPDPSSYLLPIKSSIDPQLITLLPSSPLIQLQEIKSAISSLNKNAAPGSDGLPTPFYEACPSTHQPLVQTLNNSFLQKQLSPSQRLAIVRLIPKIKSPTSAKDWRPISLLNTDYKILSSIIANRLKPILNSIISPNQHCGLPKRQIFHSHLNIKSSIDYVSDCPQPLAILQIDFYKAFDSLSHSFLLSTAEALGIPTYLITWIKICLTNLSSRLIINKTQTNPIPVKCGIRQGCPLSMLLFILGIEPLTRKILSNNKIKGISIGKNKLIVNHYADDLTIFVSDPSSFPEIATTLSEFSKYSGLKINLQKTKLLSNSTILSNEFQKSFPQGIIQSTSKILGLHFSFDPSSDDLNWKKVLSTTSYLYSSILNHHDSLHSKVISINLHILPQILFVARIFPPKPSLIKSLNKQLFKYIWNLSPFEPIKRSTLYLPKNDGGISLPSLGIKAKTAFMWQFISLLSSENPSQNFWMVHAIYNLGSKILPYQESLYSNSQPHRPNPNLTWKKILANSKKIATPPDELHTLSFKSLYLQFLNPDPIPIPIPLSKSKHTWLNTSLLKPNQSHFSNFEKEIAYRTATNGFVWGSFFLKHHISIPVSTFCKICKQSTDEPSHLFFSCSFTNPILHNIETFLTNTLNKNITLTLNTMLYNYTNHTGSTHLFITKAASFIRMSIHKIRENIILYNTHISNKVQHATLFKIKVKIKDFMDQQHIYTQ